MRIVIAMIFERADSLAPNVPTDIYEKLHRNQIAESH